MVNSKHRDVLGANWGQWTGLTTCSVTCGTGIQTRQRVCTQTQPTSTGQVCIGEAVQNYQCNLQACPATGKTTFIFNDTCHFPRIEMF